MVSQEQGSRRPPMLRMPREFIGIYPAFLLVTRPDDILSWSEKADLVW
jgi:hypothetical protein